MPRSFARGDAVVMAVLTSIGGLAVVDGLQCGHPHIGAVATIAEVTGNGVSGGFKGSTTGAVVTTGLSTGLPGHQGMVEGGPGPGVGTMAGIARQGGGNMTRAFTCGNDVVVAVGALIRGLAVVDGDQSGPPHIGAVTTIAEVAGHRMGCRFKGTDTTAIMATALGTRLPGHYCMVKSYT